MKSSEAMRTAWLKYKEQRVGIPLENIEKWLGMGVAKEDLQAMRDALPKISVMDFAAGWNAAIDHALELISKQGDQP